MLMLDELHLFSEEIILPQLAHATSAGLPRNTVVSAQPSLALLCSSWIREMEHMGWFHFVRKNWAHIQVKAKLLGSSFMYLALE